MTADKKSVLRLIDQLESTLGELRRRVQELDKARPSLHANKAVEAFADEALRARDA